MKRPPDTEYYSFELYYEKSCYRSEEYGGYFNSKEECDVASKKIINFHKVKIEELGDIYEYPQEVRILKTSAVIHRMSDLPRKDEWIRFSL
jgi:hypothetical protein